MSTRRNFFIRAVGTFAGDFAVGFAMATACVWVIQSATLGLFLSFMAWLTAIFLALALSQHVIHPVAAVVLSDRKLDQGIDALASLARAAGDLAKDLGVPPWYQVRHTFGRFTSGFTAGFTRR